MLRLLAAITDAGGRMRRVVWVITIAMVGLLVAVVSAAIAWPARWQMIWSFLYDMRWGWALAVVVTVAVFLLWLFGRLLQRPWGSPWRGRVLADADVLQYELDALFARALPIEPELRRSIDQAVRHHLQVARVAAWPEDTKRLPVGEQFIDWWVGGSIEAAYVNLHEAEIALARILPDEEIVARIPEVLFSLETLDEKDPRRRAAEVQLLWNPSWSLRRASVHRLLRLGLDHSIEQHDRLRSFRNVVLITAAGLMLLVVALCLVGAWKPDAIPLCFSPAPTIAAPGQPTPPIQGSGGACPSEETPSTLGTQSRPLPAPGDVTLVVFFGLLGGGLSAAVAVRGLQSSSTPLDIPVALTLLKLPSGALSALVGLLFVGAGFLPGLGQFANQQQILAYAFLFGIAQWIITRLVDERAQDIVARTPTESVRTPITKEPARTPINEGPIRTPITEESVSSEPPWSPAEAPTQPPAQPPAQPKQPRFSWLPGRR
jgi:hypothetical protein